MAARRPPQPDDAQILHLVEAQGLIQQRIAQQAITAARARLATFHGWYDNTAVARLATEIGQGVQSAQKVSAQTTDAYVTRVSGLMTGKTIRAAGQIDVSGLRKGTTAERVYARLARDYRYQRSLQVAEPRVLEIVRSRSDAMVRTDIQLAQRAQADVSFSNQDIRGYRRILHPELSHVTGTCGLCIAASDRVYRVNRLMPIHAGCHCGVMPVTDAFDPGQRLNESDLKRLYAQAGGTSADQLKRVQYNVHQHGELGPILTNEQYDWRGPKDVAA